MELDFSSGNIALPLYVEHISNLLPFSPSHHYQNEFGGSIFNMKLENDLTFIILNGSMGPLDYDKSFIIYMHMDNSYCLCASVFFFQLTLCF